MEKISVASREFHPQMIWERKMMPVKTRSRKLHSILMRAVQVDCAWCGSDVPVSAGDFCGVCIDCGTVMFRPAKAQQARKFARTDVRGLGGSFIPAPAV